MSKVTARTLVVAVTAVVIAALIFVASMRYSIALVAPARPLPDYALQAVLAWSGCGLVVVACAATIVVIGRTREIARAAALGSAVIVGIGVLAAVAALTLSAA